MKYSHDRRSVTFDLENEADIEGISTLCTALSSPVRLKILRQINTPPYAFSVPELVKKLGIPTTTLLFHLEKLEKADVLKMTYTSASSGTTRKVSRKLHDAGISFYYLAEVQKVKETSVTQSVSVGAYHDFTGDVINFATNDFVYNKIGDDVFHEKRLEAQLVFAPSGTISYMFSNKMCRLRKVKKIVVSLEICSEAPYYNNDYLSDVTFWINGNELTTYTIKGDYGDRRGNLNPEWWSDESTQYGELLSITVDDNGVSLNGIMKNKSVTLSKLGLDNGNRIEFTFGNKNTALNVGGFNVFGKSFGDHPQDILFTTVYEE